MPIVMIMITVTGYIGHVCIYRVRVYSIHIGINCEPFACNDRKTLAQFAARHI